MDLLNRIYRMLLVECEGDYVGLWFVLLQIQKAFPVQTPDGQKQLTIDLIKQMLTDGRITIGDMSLEEGFQAWTMPPEQAIERIRHEWDQLGREPAQGDIAWMTLVQ